MPRPTLSRRNWLRHSTALCGSTLALGSFPLSRVWSAEEASAATKLGRNSLPRMVHEQFVAEVRAILAQRNTVIQGLKTAEAAKAYVADVRQKIDRAFGPWPEKTPLNPKVTGIVERDAYRIEKVIFESRPQLFVTANLYIPKGLKGKAPGVVGSCGHSHNGKSNDTYQSFAQGLARLGYVVLIFDPIGQGERLQLPDHDDHNKSRVGNGVGEHNMLGNQQTLVGEFFGSWRAWDGMRALDYLLSREEVDPQHVGIIGNSGGGTMSTWLCGVEPRWTMGAPSCFVTGFLRNLENELPADSEQCPPNVLAQGLDHGDFLIAMAPKPVIMMGQEKDYFDARGLEATYQQVRHVYELLGAEQNVAHHIGPGGHGYQKDAREAMYAHFNKATGRGTAAVTEPELTIETDATLQCTKSGQVSELKGRPVYSFSKELADGFAKKRGTLSGEKLASAVALATIDPRRLGFGAAAKHQPTSAYRILRPRIEPAYPQEHVTTYLLDDLAGSQSLLYRLGKTSHHSRPLKENRPAVLYISHDSCDVELRDEPLIREALQAEPNAALYAVDLRGWGESRPNTCGPQSYHNAYGCDYFYSAYSYMLGRSYVASRKQDVEAVLRFLVEEAGHARVHLVARGYGTIPASLAAISQDCVAQVTLKHALTSYQEIVDAEVYRWPFASLLPGVLKQFDLPDVYRELTATKKLRLVEPWNAIMEVVAK